MAAIRFRAFAAFLAATILTACSDAPQGPQANGFDPAALNPKPACESRSLEGSPFTVCKFDAKRQELRLVAQASGPSAIRSFEALQASLGGDADRVDYAMNAGMYDEDGRPIGLFITEGKELKKLNLNRGSGNFHLMPNGVFSVDEAGQVAVTESKAFRKKAPAARWATQSGPMLVIDGKLHPKFDDNGESQLVRNGVGVADPQTAYFVISEEGVSFGRFARFFRDELGCQNALYLDGTVSSLWDPGAGRQDSYDQLGPMVVALRK
jgi:uncharacterized protein YigE (DUF2233 family)